MPPVIVDFHFNIINFNIIWCMAAALVWEGGVVQHIFAANLSGSKFVTTNSQSCGSSDQSQVWGGNRVIAAAPGFTSRCVALF